MSHIPRPARLALPRPDVVRTRRGAVEAVVTGDGPALVALHGGMGGWDQSWLLAASLVANPAAYRVVALSRPGYLGTPLDRGATPEETADLVAATLDALGIDTAIVAGVSAGGPPAACFAIHHPARCRALIMVSTCTGPLPIGRHIRDRLDMMRRVVDVPGVPATMGALMRWNWPSAAARSIADPAVLERTLRDPEAGPLFRALLNSTSRRIAARLPGTIADTDLLRDLTLPLDRIRAPTLAIHGDADEIVPYGHAERLAAAVPGAALMTIPDGGHTTLFTHLHAIRARVGDLITTVQTRSDAA